MWTEHPACTWRLAALLTSETATLLRHAVQSVVRAMGKDGIDRYGLVALLEAGRFLSESRPRAAWPQLINTCRHRLACFSVSLCRESCPCIPTRAAIPSTHRTPTLDERKCIHFSGEFVRQEAEVSFVTGCIFPIISLGGSKLVSGSTLLFRGGGSLSGSQQVSKHQ